MSTTDPATSGPAKTPIAEVVISVVFLAIFAGAYELSQDWPTKARLFPDMIAVAGMVFVVAKLVGYGFEVYRRRGQAADPPSAQTEPVARKEDDEADEDVDDPDDFSMEYVFATASRLEWATALGWFTTFFVGLYVVGVFITVPVFAFLYLRIAGKAGWIAAAIYAAVAGGLIWFVFDYLLFVPMPAGMF
jgi:hypothetical protein